LSVRKNLILMYNHFIIHGMKLEIKLYELIALQRGINKLLIKMNL
jgi:hypothetical protein